MACPGVQYPTFPTAQTPMIGITVDLVVPCKVALFDILCDFFKQKHLKLSVHNYIFSGNWNQLQINQPYYLDAATTTTSATTSSTITTTQTTTTALIGKEMASDFASQ